MDEVSGSLSLQTPRRRRRARRELQGAIDELAQRAERLKVTTWKVQPVIEVCAAENYPAWRKGRAKRWKREGGRWHTNAWPERLPQDQLGAVLLPQTHGGHQRGQPAEVAMPVFTHGAPKTGRDIEHPYDTQLLALLVRWTGYVLKAADTETALLAVPLVDLITTRPQPRVPHDLGLRWPLEPSQPHIRPARTT